MDELGENLAKVLRYERWLKFRRRLCYAEAWRMGEDLESQIWDVIHRIYIGFWSSIQRILDNSLRTNKDNSLDRSLREADWTN